MLSLQEKKSEIAELIECKVVRVVRSHSAENIKECEANEKSRKTKHFVSSSGSVPYYFLLLMNLLKRRDNRNSAHWGHLREELVLCKTAKEKKLVS